jgi:hypothetical protein
LRHGLLVLAQIFDQELGSVQVRRDELGVGAQRQLELVERLVDLSLVPVDLTARDPDNPSTDPCPS